MLWLIFGALAVLAAAVLLAGVLRRPGAAGTRAEHDLEVFRAQLRELEREVEAGLLGAAEAEAARTEIQRRMLAADAARQAAPARGPRRADTVLAVLVALAVPAAALGLYLALGSPRTPSVSFAEHPAQRPADEEPANPALADVETMMSRLEQRLADDPSDLQGWIMLGRSAAVLGRYVQAVEAYDHALALAGDLAEVHSARGEALVMAAQGRVGEDARAAFARALALDGADPRARYYMAEAKYQDGDPRAALDGFVALLDGAPADAPWYAVVRERAAGVAAELGLDPEAVLPKGRVAAATPPADPRAAAERLAGRLERNPKDFRGWIALARARMALGDANGARDALRRGSEVYAAAPFVQQQFEQAAAELGLGAILAGPRGPSAEDVQAAGEMTDEERLAMIRGMVGSLAERLQGTPDDLKGWQMLARSYNVLGEPGKAVAAYRRVLELDARDPDALYYLGADAQRRGDAAGAAAYWRRLLAQLPPGSEEHTRLQEELDRLGQGRQ
ncbi:MAG: c-type cytochrome biogenesis protein CcmI [Kiloniellaceae bacterium]